MKSTAQWLETIASINQWRRCGERAPHKPLLLLYALARLQQGLGAEMEYNLVEGTLDKLLQEFGPPRKSSPRDPSTIWPSDGLWIKGSDEGLGSPGDSRGRLRSTNAIGRLHPDLVAAMEEDSTLLGRAARVLAMQTSNQTCSPIFLKKSASISCLLTSLRVRSQGMARRDPKFRSLILVAYEYCCAMCGFDPQVDNLPVAIDVAHVRWWAAGGPDVLSNGVCLCSLHHKLFDRGALGLDTNGIISCQIAFEAAVVSLSKWCGILSARVSERHRPDESTLP